MSEKWEPKFEPVTLAELEKLKVTRPSKYRSFLEDFKQKENVLAIKLYNLTSSEISQLNQHRKDVFGLGNTKMITQDTKGEGANWKATVVLVKRSAKTQHLYPRKSK
jgi:hypothetical protein